MHAKVDLVARAPGLPPEIYITDIGTATGTYVSGMRAQRTVLSDGDLLRIGGAIALVVDREVGSYDGAVIDEGGVVRGARSRRGWWSGVERAIAEMSDDRRSVLLIGAVGCGRTTAAHRIAHGWGLTPTEIDLCAFDRDDALVDALTEAMCGAAILRGLGVASAPRQAALVRALRGKARALAFLVLIEPIEMAALPAEVVALFAHHIEVPSLEQRREEIPTIVRARFERRGVMANRLSIELYEALTRAAWPGEVAELVDSVDRIATAHPEVPRLGPEHLVRPLSRRGGRQAVHALPANSPTEADRIRAALIEAKGSVAAAARTLRLSRQALYREAARLGIDIRRTRETGSAA
jgi:hypothetical protein